MIMLRGVRVSVEICNANLLLKECILLIMTLKWPGNFFLFFFFKKEKPLRGAAYIMECFFFDLI